MALFTPGPAVAAISGSVGGCTFSRGRYGAYIRFRAKPVVSTTEKATAAKARLSAASQAWQGLTVPEQNAWNFWARSNPVVGSLGFPQELTGHAAYVGIYTRLVLSGGVPITDPPITPAPTPLTNLTFVANKTLSTCDITFAGTPLAAATHLWISGCYVASAGKHFVENLYRWINVSGAAQASPYDPFAAIETQLGAMTIGHRLILKVSVFGSTTGLLSAPLRAEDTII